MNQNNSGVRSEEVKAIDVGAAERLFEDLRFITESQDATAIFDRFCDTVRRYGFDKIVLGQAFLLEEPDNTARRFFFHRGVDDFLAVYISENFQFSDPIALRAMGTHRPFRWSEAHVDMTAAQMRQVDVAKSYNLNYGYVFPMIDRPGPTGFVSIGRETDFKLDSQAFLEVEMLARYAYLAIDQLNGNVSPKVKMSLSEREIAILLHVSKGKTNWEVGQIIGISEYSVRDYLKSLSSRLETSNRTHTVVRAIQLGLILP